MYLTVIVPAIFVFALISIVEMPNMFENVLAQDSNEDRRTGIEHRNSADRVPDDQYRSSADRSIQDIDEDMNRDLDRTLGDTDRTSQNINEDMNRDLDRTLGETDTTSQEGD